MFAEVFPVRVKNAREEMGVSQSEVARKTGIKQTTISKYESGLLQPDLDKLAILSNFYCVTSDWLIGISTSPNKNASHQIN